MSYHIYTTKGIVLSKFDIKEADRIYNILTRDLGLVKARAISVRKGTSKLRGNIEPVSIADVSFVKGKNGWRLTSASHVKSIPVSQFIARPLALLEKLVQGESHHQELFDVVEKFLISAESPDEMFETKFVAHMLYHLGYLKEEDLKLEKKLLIQAINEGLQASHLS